jgi:hypothetical protein
LGETTIPRTYERRYSAAPQPITHPFDLFANVCGATARLGGFFLGCGDRLEARIDLRLLKRDMGIDGSECQREFSVLC